MDILGERLDSIGEIDEDDMLKPRQYKLTTGATQSLGALPGNIQYIT